MRRPRERVCLLGRFCGLRGLLRRGYTAGNIPRGCGVVDVMPQPIEVSAN